MIKKTLFAKVDDTPVPSKLLRNVEVVDCREELNFCSLFSYALIGDMKDEEDMPLYKRLRPVGSLLYEFKNIDEVIYKDIISQWYTILADVLSTTHKANKEYIIYIHPKYIDWLINSENNLYSLIGEGVNNDSSLSVNSEDIYEEIVFEIWKKLAILRKERNIEQIIFSNPNVNVGKIVNNNNLEISNFLENSDSLDDWYDDYISDISTIADLNSYDVGNLIVGLSTEKDVQKVAKKLSNNEHYDYRYKGWNITMSDNVVSMICYPDYNYFTDQFKLLSSICNCEIKNDEVCFQSLFTILMKNGFEFTENPNLYHDKYFCFSIKKETQFVKCTIRSFQYEGRDGFCRGENYLDYMLEVPLYSYKMNIYIEILF